MTEPLPAKYTFSLYRGDTRVWTHRFNEAPPDWAETTAYVAGTVGSGEYLADSAVTRNGVRYTCTSAHTSTGSFDPSKWTADPKAVGAPIDITGWLFEATYRTTADAVEDVAVDECTITDGPGGVLRRTLIAEQSALIPDGKVAWDLQATKPDTSVQTYLYNYGVKVGPDVTR